MKYQKQQLKKYLLLQKNKIIKRIKQRIFTIKNKMDACLGITRGGRGRGRRGGGILLGACGVWIFILGTFFRPSFLSITALATLLNNCSRIFFYHIFEYAAALKGVIDVVCVCLWN